MDINEMLNFIGEEFDFDTSGIEPSTTFAQINFDEFDMIELVMSIEDKYMIEVPDEVLEQIITIGDLLNYLNEKL